ncbi:MAG: two-component regulator propeller domain-containing protein [Nonlabens sp.]
MRYFVLFLLVVSSIQGLSAQDFSDSWEGFFSFTNIVDLEESTDNIYGATDNAVFVYNIASRSFSTITTINGLSGDQISQIHYDESRNLLVVGYENGLLQVVDSNNDVRTVVAIRDKQVIRPERKRINEFHQNNEFLYIATDFGIALYNLDRLEFDDTYFIGNSGEQLRVQSLEFFQGFLYAATIGPGGMRRANLSNPFLLDFTNWSQINGDVWDEVIEFNNGLTATTGGTSIQEYNGARFIATGRNSSGRVLDVDVDAGRLVLATRNQVTIYDTAYNPITTVDLIDGESLEYTAAILRGNILFAGTTDKGILRIDLENPTDFEFIVQDGPVRNRVFSVESVAGQLWLGYGEYKVFFDPFPLDLFGISTLTAGEPWVNYTFEEVLEGRSFSGIVVNPAMPNEAFLNSMIDGQVEFRDGMAVQINDVSNASFVEADRFAFDSDEVRIPDGEFDRAGNLWTLQTFADVGLHRRSPSGEWTGIDLSITFPDVFTTTSMTKLAIGNQGNVYFGTVDDGLFAYNPFTEQFGNLQGSVQLGNLVNNYVTAIEVDQNNQLWIGSNLGLRVYSGATRMFEENPGDARAIIIEDVNGIPRELLSEQAVVDIEVDGNNNKWVATTASGVFLFSPTGQQTIFQFTKENSPLPSNTVNDITIEEGTGRVFFATQNGLVAFQGARASKPREDLTELFAFPNPVRPGYDGNVTIDGLTDRARIKITDIEGNLVYELVSNGGSVQWDTRNFSGNRVSSGVYLLLVNTDDTIETSVFKLLIVR